MDWISYHPLNDFEDFWKYLDKKSDFVTTEKIGKTDGKHDVVLIKISNGVKGNKRIWVDAGIHAR